MARPSIFSREYERHKKRRKRFIAFTVIFILAAAGILLAGGNIKNVVISKANNYKNIKLFTIFIKDKKEEAAPSIAPEKSDQQVESAPQDKPGPQTDSSAQSPVEEVKVTGYDIQLSDGSMLKAVYENIDGVNKFKQILPMSTNVSFDINPSGSAMVIMDAISQNMKLVDINGNVQDITAAKYTSTDRKYYNKEDVLEKYRKYNYVWCTSPKFMDDENIVYLSQLPHISSKITTKFVWAVNIKNKDNHVHDYSLRGENLKFGNITENGIELTLDNGSLRFIKFDGGNIKVSQ